MISASLVSELTLFQASVQAAAPLAQTSSLTKAALLKGGQALLTDIEAELTSIGSTLDADDPTGFAGAMPADLLAICAAATDQAVLADIRGKVGRAVFNLAQA